MSDQANAAVDPMQSLMDAIDVPSEPEKEREPNQQTRQETQPEFEHQPEPEAPPDEQAAEAQDVPEDPLYELDGEQIPLSKIREWKKGHMQEADYTRKTQEVAESRKAVEAEKQAVKKHFELQQSLVKEYAAVVALDQQLEAYEQLDWNSLIESDTEHFLKVKNSYDQLKAKREKAVTTLNTRNGEMVEQDRKEHSERVQKAREQVARDIPGWNNELYQKLIQFGIKRGYSEQDILNNINPMDWSILHDAYQYRQLQAQKSAIQNKVAAAPPVIKPGTKPQSIKQMEYDKARERLRKTGRIEDLAALL